MTHVPVSSEVDATARAIVDAAIKVHKTLGPGLLESVYEACLYHELVQRGLRVERQVAVPIVYDGITLREGLRLDLLVNNLVICELKAVESLQPVHQAQLLTQLRLSGKRLGLLLNSNVALMKDGIRRLVV